MSINEDAVAVWDAIAPEWDAGMGRDGNIYWDVLERPALERLLGEKRMLVTARAEPVRALDISTGNGLTARWLVSFLGHDGTVDIDVTATDGSDEMLAIARNWSSLDTVTPAQRLIKFARLNVTQPSAFDPFISSLSSSSPFDVVLMNMAIMDVPTLEPLAAALPQLLAVGGVFVGSLLHPVFFTSRARRLVEVACDYDDDNDSNEDKTQIKFNRALRLDRYMNVPPWRGFAMPGQARPQYYFHRPLHELFSVFLKGGQLALDGIEEPAFTAEHVSLGQTTAHSTRRFTEFPPIMVFRLRRIK